MTALALTGVAKSYGDAPVVGPLDLSVGTGERVVLLGHNGSGKTTLLRIAAGLLEPTAGSVDVAGSPPGRCPPGRRRRTWAINPCSTTTSVFASTSSTSPVCTAPRDGSSDADELLAALGLADRADDLPATFSRGMRQKAAIAMAFIRPFELLLVDEPFVGLDRTGREALLGLLDHAHASGAALVVATHELITVAGSQRVVALRDGAVVFDGPPADADIDALVAR